MARDSASVKIALILGSVRQKSNTAKALAITAAELQSRGATIDIIDPRQLGLGFPGLGDPKASEPAAKALQARLRACDGVIMVTPEYDGSYSSAIKLVIEHFGYPAAIAGKPVALLGVASGQIGAVKALEHLRSVCAHIGALVLPRPRSVAAIDKAFDANGRCLSPQAEEQLRAVATDILSFLAKFKGD